ncbi:MAG: choice-of-anchor U domain-containing protein [Candidatus Binatia bacterium]
MATNNTARFLAVTALVLAGTVALVRPSAAVSFKIDQQTFTAAGGRSTSGSFQLWSCLRPESLAGGFSSSPSFQLYSGCPGAFASNADDGDGVPTGTEDGAPNGGDGNGDGIADEIQGWVASLPSATLHGYLTLEACTDASCATTCQLENVQALREQDLPYQDPNYDFPYGLVRFTTHCSPVYVQVLFHSPAGNSSNLHYIKFGPQPPGPNPDMYYEFPGVTFDTISVGSEPAVLRARFVLRDYQLGDDDHAPGPNGVIVDPGGPAFIKPTMAPVLAPVGLGLAVGLLLLVAVCALRRPSPRSRTAR